MSDMVKREAAAVLILGLLLLLSFGPFDATPKQGLDDLIWATIAIVAVGYWTVFLRWVQNI